MFIPADQWVEEDIRARKIRIYPTPQQRKKIKEWIGTSRYVYNRCLEAIKDGKNNINFYELRNKFVIAKNNDLVEEWELKTPKDIRAGAIQDLITNYKVAFQNLKKGNITHFKMRYKTKKQTFSLRIPKTATKISNKKLTIYKRYMKKPIKLSNDRALKDLSIEHDIRLFVKRNRWYISIPFTKKSNKERKPRRRCALDPGVISFQTSFSEKEMYKFNAKKKIDKQNTIIDKIRSVLSKSKGRKKLHLKRKLMKSYEKYHNMIDDMQYKIVNFLTKRYKEILLPPFESQEMLGRNKKVNRSMLDLKHYKFKQRMISKCNLEKRSSVMIANESYTTKTCGRCGKVNKVEGRRIKCIKCRVEMDRDVNGARNIYIKHI